MKRYCRCGKRIWFDTFWNGQTYLKRFLDYDVPETTVITNCPHCGEYLIEDELLKVDDPKRTLPIAQRALERIAEVPDYSRLDGKDARGFIRIARKALDEMEGKEHEA